MMSEVASSSNGVNATSSSDTHAQQQEIAGIQEIVEYPNLYRAAVFGAFHAFQRIPADVLPLIVTPNKNTVLHISIASQVPKNNIRHCTSQCLHTKRRDLSNKFVKQILKRYPSLLLKVNNRDETPLHTAARCSDPAIIEILFNCAATQHEDTESGLGAIRQMLRMVDKMKNTALHVAAMTGSTRVVKLLTEKDPDFPYSANGHGQTPLYIASLSGDPTMAAEILQNCNLLDHGGPNGQTALHAAAVRSPEIIKAMLEKFPRLSRIIDENGWTPLHYAAYSGVFSATKILLESDPYAAYIQDKHRGMTPLLLAAGQGHKEVVSQIVRNCPDSCEIANRRDWNVLHFAMVSFRKKTELMEILIYPPVASLINDMDVNGNTPLHVLALVDDPPEKRKALMKRWESEKYSVVDKRNTSAFNVMNYGSPELKKEIEQLSIKDGSGPYRKGVLRSYQLDSKLVQQREKRKESHLVVAALIATVTFAAAFTVPGGFKEEDSKNPGSAILSKNSAFQAFVITNATAMILSLLAVFIHFILSKSPSTHRFWFLYVYELWFTIVSMGAMVIAFVTGTYAVLSSSLWVAIVVCVFGVSFFVITLYIHSKMSFMNWDGMLMKSQLPNEMTIALPDKRKLLEEQNNLSAR